VTDGSDHEPPRVSVGLPVFNGERYLKPALDAIMAQVYSNFELIISDNASSDRTEEICRTYAARHPNIRYIRNPSNIGGFRNNNQVIDEATGKYFLLTGHDDLRDPNQLRCCVELLERNEHCVLSYCATTYIDENDRILTDKEVLLKVDAAEPSERLRELIRMDHKVEPVYGLIRATALNGIRFGQFADSDRVFVAKLGLRGPFIRTAERLFFRREHAQKSTAVYQSVYKRGGWFNPGRERRFVFPFIRQFVEYLEIVRRSSLSAREKLRCYRVVGSWLCQNREKIARDMKYNSKELLRPFVNSLRGTRSSSKPLK
jgi:glycosyltransferase involved in cell wall biosynthesis